MSAAGETGGGKRAVPVSVSTYGCKCVGNRDVTPVTVSVSATEASMSISASETVTRTAFPAKIRDVLTCAVPVMEKAIVISDETVCRGDGSARGGLSFS